MLIKLPTSLLALAAIGKAASHSDFTQVPLPNTVTLIYPPGSVKQYHMIDIGVGFPNTTADLVGILHQIEMKLTLPNGTTTPAIYSIGNASWPRAQEELATWCQAIPNDGKQRSKSYGPLTEIGAHTIHWVTTWSWPSYTDPNDPSRCNGTIVSQESIEEHITFQVEASESTLGSANGTQSIPRTSTLLTYHQKPTGSAFANKSDVPNGGESLMKAKWTGLMAVAVTALGGGLILF